MKCHITTTRFEQLLDRALLYGVKLRFSGRECHIVTIVSNSGRKITMPSVHNFTSWHDYLNLITKTMQYLSENREENNE